MFGFEYVLAAMKIMINIGFAIVTAIPFYFSWNSIAPKYLSVWIPEVFMHVPYWHIVAFILVATYVGEMIQKLVPTLVRIDNSSKTTNN